jgi:hypothetical protein
MPQGPNDKSLLAGELIVGPWIKQTVVDSVRIPEF